MDESGVIWIPTVNMWANRYGHKPTYIILHGTGTQGNPTAENIGTYFANPAVEVSAHYIIGRNGIIVQCVNEHDAAWGNGVLSQGADSWWSLNPNLITISIEHVNDVRNSLDLTPVQQQASFRLIQHICQRWAIPGRKADASGGITGHFSIDPVNRRDCPGNYPWDDLFHFLGTTAMLDIANPSVANYFKFIGTNRWQCKQNGFFLGGAILTFYQTVGNSGLNGITLLGLPQSNEEKVLDSVGHAVIDHQGALCVRQRFERGEVTFDPSHLLDNPPGSSSCYMTHIDQLFQNTTTIQQEVSDIKKQLLLAQQQRDAAIANSSSFSKELTTAQQEIQQLKSLQSTQKITSTEVLNYLEQLLKTTGLPSEFTAN